MTTTNAIARFKNWIAEQRTADICENILENYSSDEGWLFTQESYEAVLDATMNIICQIEKILNDNGYYILIVSPKYSSKIEYGLFDSKMKQIA